MKRKSVKRVLLIGTVCALALTVYTLKKNPRVNERTKKESPEEQLLKSSRPTLFFHGYRGGVLSFGGMLHRLERNNYGERSIVLTVSPEGDISEEGNWTSQGNPLIQVIFEDNTNQEWQQAEWIQQILNYLAENYQTKEVNLVGHSMGGVSVMRYLASFGQEGSEVVIKKAATIGSPFNDFNEDDRELTEIVREGPVVLAPRFVEYDNNFSNIPTDIQFLNIVGDLEGDNVSDGTVPVASAVSINYLYEKYGLNYQYAKVEGKTAQHSALHENRKVDKLVADFLWKK